MTKPTIRDLIDEVRKDDFGSGLALSERVEKVLALHQAKNDLAGGYCKACLSSVMPCATVRALDGE
jgi:hypothetical protein